MTREQIVKVVEKALARRAGEVGVATFQVVNEAVRSEEDLWHVPFRPDHVVKNRGIYYDVLNSIEEELKSDPGVNVLLVPLKPEPPACPAGT